MSEFSWEALFSQFLDEIDHVGLELAKTGDEHVLAGFVSDFVEDLSEGDVAFGGVVDVEVFDYELGGVGLFDVDQEVFENGAESGPDDFVYFVKVCVKNRYFPILHNLLKLIRNQRNQQNRNTVKRRFTLRLQPIQMQLRNITKNNRKYIIALRCLQIKELKHKRKLSRDQIRK